MWDCGSLIKLDRDAGTGRVGLEGQTQEGYKIGSLERQKHVQAVEGHRKERERDIY